MSAQTHVIEVTSLTVQSLSNRERSKYCGELVQGTIAFLLVMIIQSCFQVLELYGQ
jgi:hypothetical protein